MSELYDSLQNHLDQGLDIAQASVPMGIFLAWAVNLQLIQPRITQEFETLVLRIRYGEVSGSELLIACGGDLRADMFTRAGCDFIERHYAEYLVQFKHLFSQPPPDNQATYQTLAAWLTERYMRAGRGRSHDSAASASGGFVQRMKRWLRHET